MAAASASTAGGPSGQRTVLVTVGGYAATVTIESHRWNLSHPLGTLGSPIDVEARGCAVAEGPQREQERHRSSTVLERRQRLATLMRAMGRGHHAAIFLL